jgi:uncharacterized membrane protein AbrB (regulator of aidB expression)
MRDSEAEGVKIVAAGMIAGFALITISILSNSLPDWCHAVALALGGFMLGLSFGTAAIVRQRKWFNDYFGRDIWSK